LQERIGRLPADIKSSGFPLDHRCEQLVLMRRVVDETSHQVKDPRLIRVVGRAQPIVRDIAVVERVLAVGKLARHVCAQD
jgi:hypothetical protein